MLSKYMYVVVASVMLMAQAATAEELFIAGLEPSKRPANAPVVTEFNRDGRWYQQALQGTSQPYPPSFRFLENQGAWHTPFNRPGAPGYYDIRNWHRKGNNSK